MPLSWQILRGYVKRFMRLLQNGRTHKHVTFKHKHFAL